MGALSTGLIEIGNRSSFISLGPAGSPTASATVTHSSSKPAKYFNFYDPLGSPLSRLVGVTVNDPFTFTFTNTALIAVEVIGVAVFEFYSPGVSGFVPSSEVVIGP